MKEGEFKEEINRKIRYMNFTGKYGEGKEHAIKYFFKMVEEAKKEFPLKLVVVNGEVGFEFLGPRSTRKKVGEIVLWFVKYFGE